MLTPLPARMADREAFSPKAFRGGRATWRN